MIHYNRVVDLSHPVTRTMPVWPGDPRPRIEVVATYERDGYYLQQLTLGEHGGTHIGVASHMHPDGPSIDSLGGDSLVRTAVVLDMRDVVQHNPDLRLGCDDILLWEDHNGRIPEGAVVLLCSGWSRYWSEPARYLGTDSDSILHFPGYTLQAARFLAEERGVAALGIDTHGIDGGDNIAFDVNRYWLQEDRFHLENLTRLDELPAVGVVVFIGAIATDGGSGGPARVLALVGA